MVPLLERIQILCISHNISINLLEKKAGVSHQSICKWGDSIPSGDRILKVAQYFDVSVDYLLGNTDNPKSHKNVPIYNTVHTLAALQEIKAQIACQMSDLSASFATLMDEKIESSKNLETHPVPSK